MDKQHESHTKKTDAGVPVTGGVVNRTDGEDWRQDDVNAARIEADEAAKAPAADRPATR